MSASTHRPTAFQPGASRDRRVTPDRRVEHAILSQESLARYVAETRGSDSYAGRALKTFEQRRALAAKDVAADDELVIYSLRGQWMVGTVHEIREAMQAAAAHACRRRASMPPQPKLQQPLQA